MSANPTPNAGNIETTKLVSFRASLKLSAGQTLGSATVTPVAGTLGADARVYADALESLTSRPAQALEGIDTPNAALEGFQAMAGVGQVAAVGHHSAGPDLSGETAASAQASGAAMSGLIGFVDAVIGGGRTLSQTNRPSVSLEATASGKPNSLGLVGLFPAVRIDVQTPSASITAASGEDALRAGSAQAGEQGAHVTAPPADPVDIQIAAAVAQRAFDSVKPEPSAPKGAREFVAAVASSQVAFVSPASIGAPILQMTEAQFRTHLPQEPLFAATSASFSAAENSAEVGETAPKSPRFTGMIVEQIKAAHISEGVTKIELSPRGMGVVEIEVATDGDGITNVVIRAETATVLNALREMREPWVQIPALQDAGSLRFEDKSHREDGHDQAYTDDLAGGDDGDPRAAQDEGPVVQPVIIGNHLDLMT